MLGVNPSTNFTTAGILFRDLIKEEATWPICPHWVTSKFNMRESLFFGLHLDSDNIGVVSEDKNTEESWE